MQMIELIAGPIADPRSSPEVVGLTVSLAYLRRRRAGDGVSIDDLLAEFTPTLPRLRERSVL
jgi:hypothetical protein